MAQILKNNLKNYFFFEKSTYEIDIFRMGIEANGISKGVEKFAEKFA